MSETPKPWASVTIRGASRMPQARRKQIATWLREQADFLVEHGKDFTKEYRARFHRPR